VKVTIYADPDDFILAVRAAKSKINKHPEVKDMIVSFESGVDFYVKQNKAGITVSECHRAASNQADKGRLGE
jgi:hypothetical protein